MLGNWCKNSITIDQLATRDGSFEQPDTIIDVTVVSPVSREVETGKAGVPDNPDAQLIRHEQAKIRKYGADVERLRMRFIPAAIEHTGRMGPQFRQLFQYAVHRYSLTTGIPEPAIFRHWMRRMQFSLQRCLARALIQRAHRLAVCTGAGNAATAENIARDPGTEEWDCSLPEFTPDGSVPSAASSWKATAPD